MRILQLIQKLQFRGAEIFASQLSEELVREGHQVLVVALQKGEATLPFSGEIKILEANLNWRFGDWRTLKRLARIIDEFKPDIVQANAGDTLKYSVFSKLVFGWKAKLIFRNANKISDYMDTRVKRIFNRFLITQLDHVISVSRECRGDFIKTFSYPAEQIDHVPVGINTRSTTSQLSLNEFGISGNGPVLLHVGGFVREKNHKGLLRIFALALDRNPDTTLLLIGDGKLKKEVWQLTQTPLFQNSVLFGGNRKDILAIMALCDALVLPSLIEGLPAVIIEAFYAKLPVVAYRVGGIGEVLGQNTGWLVEKEDEPAFADAIHEVLSLPSVQKQERIRQAYDVVIKGYTNEQLALRFAAIYKKIIER